MYTLNPNSSYAIILNNPVGTYFTIKCLGWKTLKNIRSDNDNFFLKIFWL